MSRKICERILNNVQIINYKGDVRTCSWVIDSVVGSLSCSSMKEIYHSERANKLRERLMNGDHSLCNIDACPYLAMDEIDSHMVEIEEVPDYPEELYLAFENVCNYSCTSCTIYKSMPEKGAEDLEKSYDKIEKQIQELLPHLKKIGTNGLGELFCSKRTLKILQNWRPIAPPEEITVHLETNGSLFDEEHWKQIENLGQYNLRVFITIMSFDEDTYQYLSGTKLPISRIENNLRFVKGLREKGIINHLQLATVVQESNFRRLPEFTRRCIEEFGADSVRLRPFEPWGNKEAEIEWFADMRNPIHPYYEEYREVMKNDIFRHPKVLDWSGGRDTANARDFPYKSFKRSYFKERILTDIALNPEEIMDKLKQQMTPEHQIVIYGIGNVGKVLVKYLLENNIVPAYILDKNKPCSQYKGIKVYDLKEPLPLEKGIDILITPVGEVSKIKNDLRNIEGGGYQGNIILIKDLLTDKGLTEEITGLIAEEEIGK